MTALDYLWLALAGLVGVVAVSIVTQGLPPINIEVKVPDNAIEQAVEYANKLELGQKIQAAIDNGLEYADNLELNLRIAEIAASAQETTESLQQIPQAIYIQAVLIVLFIVANYFEGRTYRKYEQRRNVLFEGYLNENLQMNKRRLQFMIEDQQQEKNLNKRMDRIEKKLDKLSKE